MTDSDCTVCRRAVPKNPAHCALCAAFLCKDCRSFLDDGAFSFLREVPPDLTHGVYCGACFAAKVAPALEAYEATMERARKASLFYKGERYVPPHRRANKPVSVKDCPDRKEALLRMAFFAAERSCDALVEIDVTSKKVNTTGYQTTIWSGSAFPAQLKPA